MTRDEIIKLAREASNYADQHANDVYEWAETRDIEFATLVAAAEREACANINFRALIGLSGQQCYEVSEAIRARSQP